MLDQFFGEIQPYLIAALGLLFAGIGTWINAAFRKQVKKLELAQVKLEQQYNLVYIIQCPHCQNEFQMSFEEIASGVQKRPLKEKKEYKK